MKNGANIFKSLIPAGIVAVFFLWFKGCNCGSGGRNTTDTISVKVETIREVIKHDTSYIPKERNVYVPKYIHDTLESTEYIEQKVDTSKILLDYNSTRYYSDTIPNKYGNIIVRDTVTKNMITGRGIETNLGMITTIRTYTIEAKKRNVVLVGLGVLGNQTSPLYGTELTFDLKNKNDKVYEIGAVLLRGGDLYYKAAVKWPIRLTKK